MFQKLIALIILFPVLGISQNTAIGTNEKLVFSASYNISGLPTEIAQVTMETSKVNTSSSTLMRLKCSAATYSSFDSYFKIRDLYESYVSPKSLTPYLYKRDINEGTYNKFEQYKFNHKSRHVERTMRKKKRSGDIEEKKTVTISDNTRDIVSTIYHIRNFDFQNANPGAVQKFSFLFDNQPMTINVKYLSKETLNTDIGRKECYKMAISLNKSDILKGNNDNLLWLTADANKVPVYAKFKIAVGSGELNIKSASGLKN
ncbi:MAG TPA: DUF3108 domain-containing protein [Flavobacteriaceae bacterium]|nr:DUF3108 domain-containing protein [Flavobacteriaceae bacterium]